MTCQPLNTFVINTIIPANQSLYTINFNALVELSRQRINLLRWVTVTIDTAGIYNLTTDEIVNIDGVDVTIESGYYTLTDLITILDIEIPSSGANAFFVKNNVELIFNKDSNLVYILGYDSRTSDKFRLLSPLTIPVNTIASFIVNQTNDLDTLLISSNLVNGNNSAGIPNPLVIIPIDKPIGETLVKRFRVDRTLNDSQSFNNIQYTLQNKFGMLVSLKSSINITLEFAEY